ncbi:MAG: alpha/beta hydrolase [Candidatus Omnitrophica bacterium]|nr:alpha/beta hydrolase [Candidatus Omnitrophota bacterium]MDD5236058.1 alpha/beta hydrolase [Candidatus Omnitrophota bacterium]MDD5609932.1 alpha/beta hydrolase [Candidatus Omnitrophota bacterium]
MKNPIKFLVLCLIIFSVSSGCTGRTTDIRKAKIKKVKAGDIEIAYKTIGRGYPLIMIMGYSATMDIWSPRLLKDLARYYKVIVFDNRGMGETSFSEQMFSIELFADDTAHLMDALGIKKANILGWSMGTNIALDFVLEYPDRVNKLILYAGDCGGQEDIWPAPEVMEALGDVSGTFEERGKRMLKLLFPEDWLKQHPDPRKYFPLPREKVLAENVVRQLGAMEKWQGAYERLQEIKQPTLLVIGTEDVLTPLKNSFIIAEKIPGAWLAEFKGAGHGLMYQYPKTLSNLLLTFLREEYNR